MYTIWKSILNLLHPNALLSFVFEFMKKFHGICQSIHRCLSRLEKETQEFKEDQLEAPEYRLSEEDKIRNWLDLPDEVIVVIFSQLDPLEILKRTPTVCTTWNRICKQKLITCPTIQIKDFGSNNLLNYITNSLKGIRLLSIVASKVTPMGLSEVASELPLLEELEISFWGHPSSRCDDHHLSYCTQSFGGLEVIGRCCPLLKSLKLNTFYNDTSPMFAMTYKDDADAIKNTMPGLHHLQLIGNGLTKTTLQEIVEACPRLESLDLRQCFQLFKLHNQIHQICGRIHTLRLPWDQIDDYEHFDILSHIKKEHVAKASAERLWM